MKPELPDWTVVLLGHWNMAILSPEWVTKELFGARETQVEMVFGVVPTIRYIGQEFTILPHANRVIIAMSRWTPAAWQSLETAASKLLEALPRTPISAVGINFGFLEPDPDVELNRIFQFDDSAKLVERGRDISEFTIIRQLKRAERPILNLRMTQLGGSVKFHFNYHIDVTGAEDALGKLRGRPAIARAESEEILEQVYGLRLEAENGQVE